MTIPPELQQAIALAKQQMPQLAHLPDEQVAQLIMQAMQKQQAGTPSGKQNLEKMSAEDLRVTTGVTTGSAPIVFGTIIAVRFQNSIKNSQGNDHGRT